MTNWRILLTRPQAENIVTAETLATNHIFSTNLPLLDIKQLPENSVMLNIIHNLANFKAIIVVSKPAAYLLVNLLKRYEILPSTKTIFFSVGFGTGQILEQHNLPVIYPQKGNDSEALLKLTKLQDLIKNQANFLLVKGENGRDLLNKTIKSANCNITNLELYQRINLNYSPNFIGQIIYQNQINGVFITSSQSLIHFTKLIDLNLYNIVLFVPSNRIADMAKDYGFSKIYNCFGADGNSLLKTLKNNVFN